MRRLLILILSSVAVAVFLGAAVGVAGVLGMRAKVPFVLDAVRQLSKRVFNPSQMATAGSPGAYASVVQHVGRSTGRRYETPIEVVPTRDGFAIVSPYGRRADWLRNLLVAGSATIVTEGERVPVGRPELVPIATCDEYFDASRQRQHRLFGIDECLLVRRRADIAAGNRSPGSD